MEGKKHGHKFTEMKDKIKLSSISLLQRRKHPTLEVKNKNFS